jgi:divalent metal cation (Fe/Co/Zn/Cd) transporter
MERTLTGVDWTRRALQLAWFTVTYNILEGLAAVGFGLAEESVALLGFGVDSWVEVGAAVVVLWRLRGEIGADSRPDIARERRATAIIGGLLLALAAGVLLGSGLRLYTGEPPDTTLPGVVISLLSLSFMYWLYRSKMEVARALDSRTLLADAACSRSCLQLSVVLLIGSGVYLLAPGLWWADAVAAMFLAGLIGREGWESVQAARKPEFTGGCGGCCGH